MALASWHGALGTSIILQPFQRNRYTPPHRRNRLGPHPDFNIPQRMIGVKREMARHPPRLRRNGRPGAAGHECQSGGHGEEAATGQEQETHGGRYRCGPPPGSDEQAAKS